MSLRRRGLIPIAGIGIFLLFIILSNRKADPSSPDEFKDASFKRTIVAIGDLHSYYPNALKALQLGDVVDKQGKWTGKVDYLVQTGDLVDRSATSFHIISIHASTYPIRGADTIKMYQLFDRLRDEANSAGGMLVSHLGNHEYMNMIGQPELPESCIHSDN